jgi:hypothetical protein
LDDLPASQRQFIDRFAGTGLFKVYRTVSDREFEIFIDTCVLFGDPERTSEVRHGDSLGELQRRWSSLIQRGATIHTRRLVYSSYPFSRELAERARDFLQQRGANCLTLIASSELRGQPADRDSASLVITGA